jgi:hypothetical protein
LPGEVGRAAAGVGPAHAGEGGAGHPLETGCGQSGPKAE